MALTKMETNKRYRKKHKEKIKEYNKKYYKNNKEWIKEYHCHYRKTHRQQINNHRHQKYIKLKDEYIANKFCPFCGENNPDKLVLHHLFPKEPILKRKDENSAIWEWNKSRRIKELLKCLVVCNSCHPKIHKPWEGKR